MAKILIVDDHAPNRELIVVLCRHMGHESFEAADGAQALTLVRDKRPQLVICDILMPTMDGYEFVRQLRADPAIARTEVIFYTANYRKREAHSLAEAVGVSRVIIKPSVPEDIMRAIEAALAHKAEPSAPPDTEKFDREHLRLITDKLAEKADDLQNTNLRLSALTDLNLQLASERDPRTLLDNVCHGARDLIGAKYAFICIREKGDGQAIYSFGSGLGSKAVKKLKPTGLGNGLLGKVVAEKKPLRFLNLDGDSKVIGLPGDYPPVHSVLAVPIASLRHVYGWICLVDKVGAKEFSDEDEQLLTIHAAQTGRIYENGSLYAQVESRNAQLQVEIEERKQNECKIGKLNRIYAVLSQINSLLVRVREREELFHEATRIATEAGQFPKSWFALANRDEMRLHLVSVSGADSGYFKKLKTTLDTLPYKKLSKLMKPIFEKQPVIINDLQSEPPFPLRDEALASGTRSLVWLPLIAGDEMAGVLVLHSDVPDFFDTDEMKLLLELAADIGFAINNLNNAEKLHYFAYYDQLTGLANRTLFFDRLTQLVEVAGRNKKMAAVLVMNIDRFKIINDTLGRQAGDELLVQIAKRFSSNPQEEIRYARMNADTFVVLVPDASSADDVARQIESRLQKYFTEPYKIGDTELRVSAKVGVALFPDDGTDAEALFRNAEAALKKAKVGGENFLFHTQQMTERVAEHLSLENKLRRAVEQEEFVLYYQPKVEFEHRTFKSVEALIRWKDPETGLVPPGMFIPLLEETGLILPVGKWALQQAVADIMRWRALGLIVPRVAVNVSAIQLRERAFMSTVIDAMTGFADTELLLDIEITESLIMENIEQTHAALNALRDVGVEISVDDFGTGYSSLAYLARLPINILKIDRGFIQDMTERGESITIVEAIISLAHSLQLKVVAEGVETEEQADILRGLKCDLMQGYLFSKPIPFEDMSRLLSPVT